MTSTNLLNLGHDALSHLFNILDANTLARLAQTSTALRTLATAPHLWKALHAKRWHAALRHENSQRTRRQKTAETEWRAEYAKRANADTAAATIVRELGRIASADSSSHIGSDARSRRSRLWAQILALGADVYDALCVLASDNVRVERARLCADWATFAADGVSTAARLEAIKALSGINRSRVQAEWDALVERANAIERRDGDSVAAAAASSSSSSSSDAAAPDQRIPIEEGALLLVRWYAAGEELFEPLSATERCRAELDALAAQLRCRIQVPARDANASLSDVDAVRALSKMLFVDGGFSGNESNYYAPENSLLDYVLDRRTGIPISLSVLFAAICSRVGVHLDMIGLPGHFLLATRPTADSPRTFIDVYHQGQLLELPHCINIVLSYGIPWSEDMVAPVPQVEVWTRMVRNLINCSKRTGDLPQARLLQRLLPPADEGRSTRSSSSANSPSSSQVSYQLSPASSRRSPPPTLPYPEDDPAEDPLEAQLLSQGMLEQMRVLMATLSPEQMQL